MQVKQVLKAEQRKTQQQNRIIAAKMRNAAADGKTGSLKKSNGGVFPAIKVTDGKGNAAIMDNILNDTAGEDTMMTRNAKVRL